MLHDWNGDDTSTSSTPDVNLRELYQDVTLPTEAITLTFDYRAAWELFRFGNTLPRTFSVRIEPASGGAPLIDQTILEAQPATVAPVDGIEEDTDNPSVPGRSYPPGIVDISSVAGQDVRIKFVWDVPEPGTGFAFFQLDNVRVNTLPDTSPTIDFFAYAIQGYGGSQDANPTGGYAVEYGGATLHLTGNNWKAIQLTPACAVTPSTVLEFDFISDGVRAEVNGIGLAVQLQPINPAITFAVDGTQNWGNRDFYGYSGGWQHYVIPVGSYYPAGDRPYLFFANDADAGQNTSVRFRNVQCHN